MLFLGFVAMSPEDFVKVTLLSPVLGGKMCIDLKGGIMLDRRLIHSFIITPLPLIHA